MSKIIHFSETFHPKLDGWIAEDDGGVWISFVISKEKGKGHFRDLVKELKEKYRWIKIPTCFMDMQIIALHYGFIPRCEYNAQAGEMIEMMYWEKNKPEVR